MVLMTMTIEEIAKEADLGIETVQYYQRKGLIAPLVQTPAGGQFDKNALKKLHFIRRAKELGFTIGQMKELLNLRFDPDSEDISESDASEPDASEKGASGQGKPASSAASIKDQAQKKIENIQKRIRSLKKLKRNLVSITDACDKKRPTSEFPIFDALGKAW
jgi:DNA-binding transcriptional MerR regulator